MILYYTRIPMELAGPTPSSISLPGGGRGHAISTWQDENMFSLNFHNTFKTLLLRCLLNGVQFTGRKGKGSCEAQIRAKSHHYCDKLCSPRKWGPPVEEEPSDNTPSSAHKLPKVGIL